MNIFEKGSSSLNGSLFRFEGGNSIQRFNRGNESLFKTDNAIYFSRYLLHHKYFIHKRLRQIINQILINNQHKILSDRELICEFKNIKQILELNYEQLSGSSLKLYIPESLIKLMNDNYYHQGQVEGVKLELSDRRKYGGSYGVSDEWIELINNLTFFVEETSINYDDILNYLYNLKLNVCGHKKADTTSFIGSKNSTFFINSKIGSDYHKYTIVDNLERLIDSGLIKKDSEIYKNPRSTIGAIINEYSLLREASKEKMDKILIKQYGNK